ncbi:MAG: hypothetical protein HKP61_16865 [Dactylosporangium sp.]|nr:hypothetical protein [Dactylosporangium sp.]NNJ62579.1 hypothetical protein [Dactylosporangium sp.]
MADHDVRRTRGGTPPPTTPGQSPPSPPDGESPYHAAAPRLPADEPLTVRVELLVVDGPAGDELLSRQAIVIRRALCWLATHRSHDPDQEPPVAPSGTPPPATTPNRSAATTVDQEW